MFPWPTLFYIFLSLAVGFALGHLDRLTSWKPTLFLGGACAGVGEPLMLFLYHQGYLTIDDAFHVGAGFLIAGMLGVGCGMQKAGRVLQIQQDQLKAERAAEEVGHRQTATQGICPGCDAVIATTSEECSRCGAIFGQGSAWKVKPLSAFHERT
ncbi:hypothetical protein ACS5PN_05935 [Roseateles sp. NT4]|uniref:hypothetical protein n=1 Tax=Roseateles sp. NT4 TaxID=3453715 RepID=UPI003EEB855D